MIKLTIKVSENTDSEQPEVNINLEKISKKDLQTATENEKLVADLVRNTLQNLTQNKNLEENEK